jgi:vacuolar-type H+-ATPase subunit E/Vma4
LRHGQQHAQHLLAQAHAQAETIARRADACISKLHSTYLQKVQRNIESLAQSSLSSGEHTDNAYDRGTLIQAVRRVAIKLTDGT